MKTSIEEINSVQKRVKISLSPETVDEAFNRAFTKIKKTARIQGFRQGKAPLHIIKKLYKQNVTYEVGETLINEHLFDVMQKEGVNPVASPFVEDLTPPSEHSEYSFSAVVDILPSIPLEEHHKGIKVNCLEYKAEDLSIEREVEILLRRSAKTSPCDEGATAEKGKLVILTQNAYLDGKELEDLHVENTPIIMGRDDVFADLEAAMTGMKKGEEKSVDIKLPDTFPVEELVGKSVNFKLKVNDLLNIEIPELNDEFAKDNNFENVDELKKSVTSFLEQSAKTRSSSEKENALMDELVRLVPFEVPPALVDKVIDSIIEERLGHGQDRKHLKTAMKDKGIREKLLPEAQKKAKNTMLLWEIVKKEEIKATDEDVKNHIIKIISEGSSKRSEDELDAEATKIMKQSGERIRESLLFEKAVDFVIDNGTVEVESVAI